MSSTHKNSTSTATVRSGSSSTSNSDDEFYDVIIVGAGLSGFTVAYELTRYCQTTNLKVLMLEARDRLGGRIHSIPCSSSKDHHRVDLGPAWVWPTRNPNMCELLQQLNLEVYEQYLEGDHLLIRSNQQPPQHYSSHQVETGHEDSFRIVGGTYALIDAVHKRLNTTSNDIADTNNDSTVTKIQLNEAVTSIEYKSNNSGPTIEVITRETNNQDSDGNMNMDNSKSMSLSTRTKRYRGSYVVVTLPPQLAAITIQYQPPLPTSVRKAMLQTNTWMGHAMKVALVYKTPFWRLSGKPLSGTVMVYEPDERHPIQQYHDASSSSDDPEAEGALFGWISNDPLTQKHFRTKLTKQERQQSVLQQTCEIFGPEAKNVIQYEEMDWMTSPYTSLTNDMKSSTSDVTQQDLFVIERSSNHYGRLELQGGLYDNHLWWASTEASENNGGFLEGAIYNGKRIAHNIIEDMTKNNCFNNYQHH